MSLDNAVEITIQEEFEFKKNRGFLIEVNAPRHGPYSSMLGEFSCQNGSVDSRVAAEHFAAHLAIAINPDFETTFLEKSGAIVPKDQNFNEPGPGYRKLVVVPKRPSLRRVRDYASQLGKRIIIAARNEKVDMCDYTAGFMREGRTIDSLWIRSNYEAADPGEYAIQLAYEISEGMRKPAGNKLKWFSAVWDQVKQRKDMVLEMYKKVQDTFDRIDKKEHMPAQRVVDELVAFAAVYFALAGKEFKAKYQIK